MRERIGRGDVKVEGPVTSGEIVVAGAFVNSVIGRVVGDGVVVASVFAARWCGLGVIILNSMMSAETPLVLMSSRRGRRRMSGELCRKNGEEEEEEEKKSKLISTRCPQ